MELMSFIHFINCPHIVIKASRTAHKKEISMKFLIAFISLISIASAQTIVCKKSTEYGEHKVTITDSKVTVSLPGFSQPRVFTNLQHANGLITDDGLAVYFENHYGCIRNAIIITDAREPFNAGYMRPMDFGTCSGGSTPDDLCHPNH